MTIYGKGGHAASPELNIDPIIIGAHLVQQLNALSTKLTTKNTQLVMCITEFNSGVSKNITPEVAILGGTIRSPTISQRELAKNHLHKIVNEVVTTQGAQAHIEIFDHYPPTVNSSSETQLVFNTTKKLLSDVKVNEKARAAEDFSFYLEKIPSCYFLMGNGATELFYNPLNIQLFGFPFVFDIIL